LTSFPGGSDEVTGRGDSFADHLKSMSERIYPLDPARSIVVTHFASLGRRVLFFWTGITVLHVEWISLHDMSVLIIAFNVTMSFRMMATMATLKGFPLARSF
jgi:hypothetical protein